MIATPPSRSRRTPPGRGRWLAAWVFALSILAACATTPPETTETDLDAEPISPQVVRLLERAPGTCLGTHTETAAEDQLRAGKIAFKEQRYAIAGSLFESAAQALAASGDLCRQVDALNELGKTQRWRELIEPALATYSQALDLAESVGYLAGAAETLNNLGVLETNRQGFRLALEHYAGARALWQRVGNPQELLLARQNAGLTLFYLGRWASAQRVLTSTTHGFEALGHQAALDLGIGLTGLGRAQAALGDLTTAEQTLAHALEIVRGVGDPTWIGSALDALASVLLESERWSEAEAVLEQARGFFADGDPRSRANVLGNLADLYERVGRLEEALATCHRVREMIAAEPIQDPHLAAHIRFIEARAQRKLGHLEIATALMEPVIDHLEAVRSKQSGDLLASFFALRRSYYDLYVDLLLEQGQPAKAFNAAELAQSRGLLDRLIWHPSEVRAAAGSRLNDLDAQVRQRLDALAGRLDTAARATPPNLDAMNELSAEAAGLRLELARLEAEMRLASGGQRAAVKPLQLEQILPGLDADTLLLVYWLGPERSVLWEIDRSGIRAHPDLLPRRHLETAAAALRSALAKGPRARRQADRELHDLAPLLLGPLAGRDLPEHLLIIPDGALALVPFAALPSVAYGEQGRPLIEQHTISFGYSVSMVAAIQASSEERRQGQDLDLALVSDPVSSPDDPRLPSYPATTPAPAAEWPRLTWAAPEGESIKARVAPARRRVLEGFAASRERILAGALSGARRVHIAAHGELHPENPELSYLVLSSYDPRGRPIDGRFRLDDVEQLTLDADVVVLSGCSTAIGKIIPGEGPLGFPQGFLYSGAASVIASLGSVDDLATSKLMQVLYRELFDNHLTAAQALRRAQLELARSDQWSDPAYWAPFVLLGDWKT